MRFESSERKPIMLKTLAAAAAIFAFAACDKSDNTSPDASSGLITITSPKAGSTWHVGDSLEVNWTVKDDPNNVVDAIGVSVSPDGGKTWGALHSNSISPENPKWGKFRWKITDSLYINTENKTVMLAGSTTCRVKVAQYTPSNPALMIVTTGDFTIAP